MLPCAGWYLLKERIYLECRTKIAAINGPTEYVQMTEINSF